VVIQERSGNNFPVVVYTRGSDLSGTFQGAGGIGGLLARTDSGLFTVNSSAAHSYYHADGNGNITALINTNQAIVAKYLYDPFGNILSQSGSLADTNLYRFSSKESHKNSGLVYYLYRFYDPNLQRWLNRDPLQDYAIFRRLEGATWADLEFLRSEGQRNAYVFSHNTPVNGIDTDGLCFWGLGGILRPIGEGFLRNPLHPILGMLGNCGGQIAATLGMIELGNRGVPGFPAANADDRLQHCITSCKLTRACGSITATGLGLLKEGNDLLWGGSVQDSKGDLAANKHGRAGACDRRSCEDYCNSTRGQYPPAYNGN
jgi:RHS repeat-associated protein